MKYYCPNCNEELPWWRKYVSRSDKIGAVFDCKNCGAWIRFRTVKKLDKFGEILFIIFFIIPLFFAFDLMERKPIFIDKLGLDPNYGVGLILLGCVMGCMFFICGKTTRYKLEIVYTDEVIDLKRTTFYLALVFFGPMLAGLFLASLYMFLESGEAILIYMWIALVAFFSYNLKRERNHIKTLKKKIE